MRTDQWIPTRVPLVSLPVGQPGNALDSSLAAYLNGRVRRWLHLPPGLHRATGVVGLARPATAVRPLSPAVAGRAAPCCTSFALQPFEDKALRKTLPAGIGFALSWEGDRTPWAPTRLSGWVLHRAPWR